MDRMHMVTVVAREAFPYDGIPRRVGETFEATPEDARLLTLIGKVDRAAPMASRPSTPDLPADLPADLPVSTTRHSRARRSRESVLDDPAA